MAGAAILFGTTFVVVQGALAGAAPVPFVAVRFALAAGLLWPVARRRPTAPGIWPAGLAAGVCLLAGYLLQTIGLRYVTTSVSAFVTYLLVVLVPILSALVWRRVPGVAVWVGAALAALGLFLLTGAGVGFGPGVLLTLGCALAFALNILVLAQAAPRFDAIRLTAIQLLVVGAGAAVPGIFLGGYHMTWAALGAALYTAVAASAVAFSLQVWGQRRLSPARTSLLLMIEPVTAAAVGWGTGERLGPASLVGAALILAGIVVTETWPGAASGPPTREERAAPG